MVRESGRLKKLRLRLILDVSYDTHGVSEEELRVSLGYIVRHAMGEGLFTNDTEAEVDTCTHRIETVQGLRHR